MYILTELSWCAKFQAIFTRLHFGGKWSSCMEFLLLPVEEKTETGRKTYCHIENAASQAVTDTCHDE